MFEHEERSEGEADRPAEDSEQTNDEIGAEGGPESPAADRPPAVPSDDDAAVGDTDQHSQA